MTDNRLVWDTHFTSIYHVCAWHPSVAHSNTAPRWVKTAKTALGHHQTWHEFVWCAKLRREWAWLPSGRTEEVSRRVQNWASHREGINESWSLKLKSSRQSKLIQASEARQGDNRQKQYKRETIELNRLDISILTAQGHIKGTLLFHYELFSQKDTFYLLYTQ